MKKNKIWINANTYYEYKDKNYNKSFLWEDSMIDGLCST